MDPGSVQHTDGWFGRLVNALFPSVRARAEVAAYADRLRVLEGEMRAVRQQAVSLTSWQQLVETHLASLQAAHDTSVETTRALAAEIHALTDGPRLSERPPTPSASNGGLAPVLEWIRSAETHLHNLQAETERLQSLLQRNEQNLASLKAGLDS